MKTPNTTAELASAIEALIGLYMDGIRSASQQAVSRALGATPRGASTRRGQRASKASGERAVRRTPASLESTCDTLCETVRANPGASIAMLAEKMGVRTLDLQRPMVTLKVAGRVRSVGERRLMRYYPSVARTAVGKE
jgi:hypothetical protein